MEEPRNRFILLQDRSGEILETGPLGLFTKSTPTQLLKGELLEALPDSEQPGDSTRITLGGIDRKLRVECRMEDVMKLTVEEADLLLAISSATLRYQICVDRKRLDFGKRLEYGSMVLVSINGFSKKLPGVVLFKGESLNSAGTMFGIELHHNPGHGTCDGTLKNQQYFKCAADSGVFVGLDKLSPLEDDNLELRTPSKSPKKDNHGQVNIKSNVDLVNSPPFFRGKSDPKLPQPRNLYSIKTDQRVVTFDKGPPLRGTVRFTGDIKNSNGQVQIVVGLELDEKCGTGTGKWKGNQLFLCKRDHACFVDIESIMLEEEYDKDLVSSKERTMSEKQDKQPRYRKEERRSKEIFAGSLSCDGQYETVDEQFEENASSRQSTSLDSATIVPARESKMSSDPFISATSSDIHQLKGEDKRLKHKEKKRGEDKITRVIHLVKERNNLLAQQKNLEKELQKNQQEKDEIVKEKDNLQTDLRAKESQVHELETSLTTAQQTMEDIQQMKNENNILKLEKCQLEKEKNDVQEEKDELVVQNNSLQTDLRAKEAEVHRLKTTLTTAQQALEDIQQLKNENNRLKLENCQWEKEKNDLQEEKDELGVQNNSLQTDLRAKEAEVHRLETTLATAQRALEECQQVKKPCDWVVSRDEVEMTDKCLGVGGWGKVVLGTFRGCKVAVKEIHELILSPYNRRLFEREMNIASKCRHPCLLQFIGATNDDGIPLFITELLETSLRALLEQRQLAETEISIISLDVSLALNYLHNMKPSPILHRDVSSANVLLWRQGDQWRGKVSDYGTAKFVQQTMTRAPGAVIYSAPEAVSSNQTPKVDVYSFGVLVCEMCIREMPDPERRNQQVLLVKSHIFRNLVHECLKANPVERPEMSRIIQEIQRFEG